MLYLLIGFVAVAVAATVVAVSTGRVPVDPLAEATRSTPDHGLPALPAAADVDAVRFDTAPRGYHPADVDAHLDELRDALADRERELALLRAEAPDGRSAEHGRTPHGGLRTEDDRAPDDDGARSDDELPDDDAAVPDDQAPDDDARRA
ncbi:MAG: DivIVA domain-containing protein [Phycicoccus sp.]